MSKEKDKNVSSKLTTKIRYRFVLLTKLLTMNDLEYIINLFSEEKDRRINANL